MTDETAELRTELRAALERITALEARLDPEAAAAPTALLPTVGSDAPPTTEAQSPTATQRQKGEAATPAIGRRHLLGRAGTAAIGAALGGTAVGVASASPAAAATATFDTNDATPALTVTTTGTGGGGAQAGPGVRATSSGSAPAVEATSTGSASAITATGSYALVATGRTQLEGETSLSAYSGQALSVRSYGPNTSGMSLHSDSYGALFLAVKTAVWGVGSIGVVATGWDSNLWLRNDPTQPMLPPPTRTDAHNEGEIYLDQDAVLWLCVASGTPGTWTRIGGAGTAGAFTVLPTPTRVYDTRPGSGLPGSGTGPVTGIRKNIDLTANSSGLPTDATAAMVTLTATNTQPNAAAYGQIYANGLTTPPGTSTINWTAANDLVATTTTTALTTGKVAITMNPGANVLIDVIGYWR